MADDGARRVPRRSAQARPPPVVPLQPHVDRRGWRGLRRPAVVLRWDTFEVATFVLRRTTFDEATFDVRRATFDVCGTTSMRGTTFVCGTTFEVRRGVLGGRQRGAAREEDSHLGPDRTRPPALAEGSGEDRLRLAAERLQHLSRGGPVHPRPPSRPTSQDGGTVRGQGEEGHARERRRASHPPAEDARRGEEPDASLLPTRERRPV
mmetsp:Transcript_10536/g.25644  ORF Transcript_10536/g.25644 Transcript_10536/m.25644 type:complete len:207 (-) Transcript_10536:353-973(-)